FQEGVRAGYQTMDVLGAAAFSIIILDSALVKGRSEGHERMTLLARASIGAAVMLGIIYGGLAYLGATSTSLGTDLTQAGLLVAIVQSLLGEPGIVLLSAIVLLACVTTAVALVSSAADYFYALFGKRVSYNVLLLADCVIGVLICDLGLDAIIQLADPVLGIVYPPFITVVVLLVFHKRIKGKGLYRGAAIGAFAAAVVLELHAMGIITFMPLDWLPLHSMGLGWLVFAVLGGIVGWIIGRTRKGTLS
ncbi:MAG: branched-chain amino acid transport system II carrier protein, partial [Bacteroidales bacterium]